MVVTGDIGELFGVGENHTADVWVNKQQEDFEWASAMLFDCDNCTTLTPDYVQTSQHLFDFGWASRVGSFPAAWNKAVGYAAPGLDANLYHFTKGIPIWRETRGNVEDQVFHEAYKHMLHSVSHDELMGNSVHVRRAS